MEQSRVIYLRASTDYNKFGYALLECSGAHVKIKRRLKQTKWSQIQQHFQMDTFKLLITYTVRTCAGSGQDVQSYKPFCQEQNIGLTHFLNPSCSDKCFKICTGPSQT